MQAGYPDKYSYSGSRYSPDCWNIISIGILAGLFVLDILTTEVILSGGGVEYNPFMAGIVRNPLLHIVVKLMLLVLVGLAAKYSEDTLKGSGTILVIVIIGWYLVCVSNNIGSITSAVLLR
jgi:hypothetical protein